MTRAWAVSRRSSRRWAPVARRPGLDEPSDSPAERSRFPRRRSAAAVGSPPLLGKDSPLLGPRGQVDEGGQGHVQQVVGVEEGVNSERHGKPTPDRGGDRRGLGPAEPAAQKSTEHAAAVHREGGDEVEQAQDQIHDQQAVQKVAQEGRRVRTPRGRAARVPSDPPRWRSSPPGRPARSEAPHRGPGAFAPAGPLRRSGTA